MTLDKLQMHQVSFLRPGDPDWKALGSLCWADINKFISMATNPQHEPSIASLFVYAKPMRSLVIDETSTAVDVFRLTAGVFGISVSVYHEEDMGCSYAEPIGHYVGYNADTRVLFTYPEVRMWMCMCMSMCMCPCVCPCDYALLHVHKVVVLQPEDTVDPSSMLDRLKTPPYLISFNRAPNSFHRDVRQLFFKPDSKLAGVAPLAYDLGSF